MLTQVQLVALHRSHRGERVLSAYVDGTAANPAEQRAWRVQVDRGLKDVRSWLEGSAHAEREEFERCARMLEAELDGFDPSVGAPGWAGFITSDGVIDAQRVPVPMPTLITWSTGPCIAPYVRALKEEQAAVIVLTDARRAELHRYRHGRFDRVETIRAHHAVGRPTHMGDAPRRGFHTGTRGTAGRDAAQQSMLEGRDRMLVEAAERATDLAGPDGWILIAGIPRVVARLDEILSATVPDRVGRVSELDIHASDAAISEAARTGATSLRQARDLRVVSEIVDRSEAGGLGAVGASATQRALGNESVFELVVTRRYLEDHAPEAEDAVRAAFDQRAAVEEVSGPAADLLDRFGGIGAMLRFHAEAAAEPELTGAQPSSTA